MIKRTEYLFIFSHVTCSGATFSHSLLLLWYCCPEMSRRENWESGNKTDNKVPGVWKWVWRKRRTKRWLTATRFLLQVSFSFLLSILFGDMVDCTAFKENSWWNCAWLFFSMGWMISWWIAFLRFPNCQIYLSSLHGTFFSSPKLNLPWIEGQLDNTGRDGKRKWDGAAQGNSENVLWKMFLWMVVAQGRLWMHKGATLTGITGIIAL